MGRRILVVDDDALTSSVLADWLTAVAHGYDVDTADSGVEALAKMDGRPFDLVITDLRMPEMDGLALIERIRVAHPETATVLMTADRRSQLGEAISRLGSRGKLEKPFSDRGLLDIIEATLAQAT